MHWMEIEAQLLAEEPKPLELLFGVDRPGVYAWWDLTGALAGFFPKDFPPVDYGKPVYVGVSEVNVGQRFRKYHRRRVGRSSPRFSLAALLFEELELLPGALILNGKAKLHPAAERRLTEWMNHHLLFTCVPLNAASEAAIAEEEVIGDLLSPLNIEFADEGPYQEHMCALRAALRCAIRAQGPGYPTP